MVIMMIMITINKDDRGDYDVDMKENYHYDVFDNDIQDDDNDYSDDTIIKNTSITMLR